jgi:hypothetical protein
MIDNVTAALSWVGGIVSCTTTNSLEVLYINTYSDKYTHSSPDQILSDTSQN